MFSDEFTTVTVCEGDQLQIRCSKTTRIAVLSAMFGRTAAGDKKCPELLRNTSSLETSKNHLKNYEESALYGRVLDMHCSLVDVSCDVMDFFQI